MENDRSIEASKEAAGVEQFALRLWQLFMGCPLQGLVWCMVNRFLWFLNVEHPCSTNAIATFEHPCSTNAMATFHARTHF